MAVSSWRRLSDNAIPARVKATGSYINSSLAATEAKQAGFHEAIFLREDGTVAEGSAMNIFMVLDGKLITTPPTSDILVGITRNTVMQLAREQLNLEVVERPDCAHRTLRLRRTLLLRHGRAGRPRCSSVDRRDLGDPGEITRKLQKVYFDTRHRQSPGIPFLVFARSIDAWSLSCE